MLKFDRMLLALAHGRAMEVILKDGSAHRGTFIDGKQTQLQDGGGNV